jgi:hypothetical protein
MVPPDQRALAQQAPPRALGFGCRRIESRRNCVQAGRRTVPSELIHVVCVRYSAPQGLSWMSTASFGKMVRIFEQVVRKRHPSSPALFTQLLLLGKAPKIEIWKKAERRKIEPSRRVSQQRSKQRHVVCGGCWHHPREVTRKKIPQSPLSPARHRIESVPRRAAVSTRYPGRLHRFLPAW